ncbi:MAG: methyltransferase domain-containing protein [Myxococcota bacterium]
MAPLLGEGYVTTDLRRTDVTTQQDITRMTFADGSFGTIVCSHVLEHIPDDRGALSELARVLRPGGHLLVQVPFNHHGLTDEDPSVTDPEERLRRWGELDHLRLYGSDLVDRMTSAGFDVDTILVESGFPRELQERHGLAPDQVVFVGRRRG